MDKDRNGVGRVRMRVGGGSRYHPIRIACIFRGFESRSSFWRQRPLTARATSLTAARLPPPPPPPLPLPRHAQRSKFVATAVGVDTGVFLWRYEETNKGDGAFADGPRHLSNQPRKAPTGWHHRESRGSARRAAHKRRRCPSSPISHPAITPLLVMKLPSRSTTKLSAPALERLSAAARAWCLEHHAAALSAALMSTALRCRHDAATAPPPPLSPPMGMGNDTGAGAWVATGGGHCGWRAHAGAGWRGCRVLTGDAPAVPPPPSPPMSTTSTNRDVRAQISTSVHQSTSPAAARPSTYARVGPAVLRHPRRQQRAYARALRS